MFVITNRQVDESTSGLDALGDRPNAAGPLELRLAEATKAQGQWTLRVLPNVLTEAMKREAGIRSAKPVFASRYVVAKILAQIRKAKRNFLFFVHGYNNDIQDVLERASRFEQLYNVEVLAFSWPANGGGARGVADYLSDKRDAQASAGALGRCLDKVHEYLATINQAAEDRILERSATKFPNDAEQRNAYIACQREEGCPFTVNMVLHSMGNYVMKNVMQSSVNQGGRKLLFDNVALVAADANNEDHAGWVDLINCRKRLYVTINEEDIALRASRMKTGSEQKARLGHYPFNLNAEKATYVNFTDVPQVGRSHAYFEGDPIQNPAVRRFFQKAFNGLQAEDELMFDPSRRLYQFPRA